MKHALGPEAGAHRDAVARRLAERAVSRIWAGDASFWKSADAYRKLIDFQITCAAQAAGDLAALQSRGRRALTVHFGTDLAAGLRDLAQVVAA